jgi:signal transduction histidine kinase/CheY-like chemotaxis protein
MEAPKPTENEVQRLQALYDSEILDTEREQIFDNLTALVGKIFDVPIVAISLVDKNRQWFKSSQGLDVCETNRDISFCGHAVHGAVPFIINDATADPRFHDNPLVTGGPNIAFYAGVPLKYGENDDLHIGTLCIIDSKPRDLSAEQVETLKSFATQVELLIEQRLERDSSVVANKAKSTFLANMSHEIRTPISGVIGVLDILEETSLDEEQTHKVAMASKSANQLLHLVNDILDFSKIEADKLRLNLQTFALKDVFTDIASAFELVTRQSENQLTLEYDWPENTHVHGDPFRLKQILNNLVSNANKFTHHGDILIRAGIEPVSEGELKLQCVVKDTGIGIAAEDLPRLFQSFEQIENSATRRFGGSGLGLIISQKLCRLMGGDITVESKQGAGSSFAFHVYLSTAEAQDVVDTDHKQTTDDIQNLHEYKILLVEDDLTNRVILEHFLRKLNVVFDTCENGQQVCDKLSAGDTPQYDLVITDCQMPLIDGYQLTNMMRAGELGDHFTEIPIIALTANAMKGDREKCIIAGMNDYITKPVSAEDLSSKINQWLK